MNFKIFRFPLLGQIHFIIQIGNYAIQLQFSNIEKTNNFHKDGPISNISAYMEDVIKSGSKD